MQPLTSAIDFPPSLGSQVTTADDLHSGHDARKQREIYQIGMVQARHRRLRRCALEGGEGEGPTDIRWTGEVL